MIKAKIEYDPDPIKRLESLRTNIRTRILKKAMRSAIRPLVLKIRSTVSKKTGTLAKSITSKVDALRKNRSIVFGVAGNRSNFERIINGKTKIPGKYVHLVEKRRPFLAPALASSQSQIKSKLTEIIEQEIKKELKK